MDNPIKVEPVKPVETAVAATPAVPTPEPTPEPTTAPPTPKSELPTKELAAPVPEAAKKSGGSTFSNIFNQKKTQNKDTTVMKTILEQKGAPKMKPILGSAPALQKSLEESKVLRQKKTLRLAQMVFVLVFVASLGMAGYFYSELSPTFDLFGPNTTAKLTDVNKNLRSAQTTINKYRYLAAQLDLNAFSLVSDDFLDKTALMATNASKLAVLNQNVTDLAEELPNLLVRVKENLTPSIIVDTYHTAAEEEYTEDTIKRQFEAELKASLTEDRKKITSVETLSAENEQDLRLIDNTLKLVGNNKLLTAISNVSADALGGNLVSYVGSLDPEKRKELSEMMKSVLISTKSDIAIIGALKSSRIDWAWIIDKIEEVTATVDPNFNAGLFEVTGLEIVYTGYELDSKSNKIVLSGYTKTNDARNFSIISDLIDEMEKSVYFETVEMRSFSKSGTFETGFTANFKLDLNIEQNGDSVKNAPIALVKRKVASKGVKRVINNQ